MGEQNKPQKFTKRPVTVEAMQFTNDTKDSVFWWAKEIQYNVENSFENDTPVIRIPTAEGEMICRFGDYLIKEPFPTETRKLYPCKQDVFEQTYFAAQQPQEGKPLSAEEILRQCNVPDEHNQRALADIKLAMEKYAEQKTAALREELVAVKKEKDGLFKVVNDLQSSNKGAMNDKIIFEKGFNAAKEATDKAMQQLSEVTRQRDEANVLLRQYVNFYSYGTAPQFEKRVNEFLSRLSSGETKPVKE